MLALPFFQLTLAFSPNSLLSEYSSINRPGLLQRFSMVDSMKSINGINGDATYTDTDAESNQNETPHIRLNVEEKAKTVISVCKSGTLCTKSKSEGIDGAPFGSFVDYVLDGEGNPILLMNEMSMHTLNIASDPGGLVTLFAQLSGKKSEENIGQDVSRCSITGTVQKIDPDTAEDLNSIRMKYSIKHAYADQVMDSPKFAFYRLIPKKVYFVGGFGVLAKWIPVEQYREAAADILASEAADIVSKLNAGHTEDLYLTAKHLLGLNEIEMIRVTNIDRLGMDMRVTTKGKRRNKLRTDEFRIGFRIPVISVEDAKSEVLKIFQESWEKGNGLDWGEEETAPGADIPYANIAADDLE